MKTYKLLTAVVFILLIVSATSSSNAYTPRDEGFVQVFIYATPEDPDNVLVGDLVDMTIVVKNLTNDTASNFTITQEIRSDSELISLHGYDQELTNENSNETVIALSNITLSDPLSGQSLDFTYFNITQTESDSNFTANLDLTLAEDEQFAFGFVLNFTESGEFVFAAPEVVYYDHWPDRQVASRSQGTEVIVVLEEEDSRTQYIPSFNVEDPNYTLIIGGFIAVFLVAILSRILHFKSPVEL